MNRNEMKCMANELLTLINSFLDKHAPILITPQYTYFVYSAIYYTEYGMGNWVLSYGDDESSKPQLHPNPLPHTHTHGHTHAHTIITAAS